MIILGTVLLIIGVIYILTNFILVVVRNCKEPGVYMWRHLQFVKMLPAFVILFTAAILGLGFTPYSYSA